MLVDANILLYSVDEESPFHDLRAGLVSDAALAALCIEHGLAIVSADSDFARFPDVERINPL